MGIHVIRLLCTHEETLADRTPETAQLTRTTCRLDPSKRPLLRASWGRGRSGRFLAGPDRGLNHGGQEACSKLLLLWGEGLQGRAHVQGERPEHGPAVAVGL